MFPLFFHLVKWFLSSFCLSFNLILFLCQEHVLKKKKDKIHSFATGLKFILTVDWYFISTACPLTTVEGSLIWLHKTPLIKWTYVYVRETNDRTEDVSVRSCITCLRSNFRISSEHILLIIHTLANPSNDTFIVLIRDLQVIGPFILLLGDNVMHCCTV